MNMDMFMPTKLITGKDCVLKSSALLKKYGKSCLIVTGKNSAKICGALDDVTNALDKEGISYIIYDGIGQNPKMENCLEAAKIASDHHLDFIIGIGGGSPLDASKCIAVYGANPGYDEDKLYSLKWENEPLPIVLVGTTSGTGSEVTAVAVITDSKGRKHSFKADNSYASLAFGDYKYTMHLNDHFTRSTVVDALAHCLESYFSNVSNEISQAYAIRGIEIIMPILDKMAKNGTESLTEEDRKELYHASIYGGLAINITGTAMCHAISYLLTEVHQVSHGYACGATLVNFLDINKEHNSNDYEKLFKKLNMDDTTFISILTSVMPDLGICMDEKEINEVHSRWINNGSINKTYGNLSAEFIDDLLRQLFVKE